MEYNPREVEPKWRKWWEENHTYRVSNESDKPKYYILDMFPYPSGAGLHVGHPLGYIVSDILARYKRLRGFNVLHPMGYDSFGLPAEQYAIQTGIHPSVSTEQNINRYREQLEGLGLSFDWSREVRTSDPQYYKWTQWIFGQLFEHYYDTAADKALPIADLVSHLAAQGTQDLHAVSDDRTPALTAAEWNALSARDQQLYLLNYRLTFPEESFVNWCPALGTVLSNDEVKDGVSERGGYPVERKLMKQWSMRITAYADRLLAGLDTIDWPTSLKDQQRNWIGRSQGASVRFPLDAHPEMRIEVFTTRIDTIYGVTFLVLAPEHEYVSMLTAEAQRAEVEAYVRWAASRSERDRMAETKRVTGAFTGSYAVNPFNGQKVPVYIADYVLAGYGTGAVMAVPSGDQRDWSFAKHFDLPIVPILDAQQNLEVEADATKEGRYINSGIIDGMMYAEAVPTLIHWLEEKGLGKGKVQYKLRNAVFSRQRYWGEPVPVYWNDGVPYLLPEHQLPLVLPAVDKYLPTETGEPPLGRAEDWRYHADGQSYEYELSTMPGWAGSSWYFYRYMDPLNDQTFCSAEAMRYWQDVDFYIGGSEHAVGHLLYSRFWNHFLHDLGVVPHREFAKRLVNQGMIQGRSNFVFRAREHFFEEFLWIKVLQPLLSEYGPVVIPKSELEEISKYDFAFGSNDLVIEVTSHKQPEKVEIVHRAAERDQKRLLVLYSEHMIAYINEPERIAAIVRAALASRESFLVDDTPPTYEQLFISADLLHKYSKDSYTKLHVPVQYVQNDQLNVAEVLGAGLPLFEQANFKLNAKGEYHCTHEVEKMSKSKYNVVNPDDMVEQYGADCFRMFEMFLGPIEDSKPWNTQGISGVANFLRKFWSLFFDAQGNLAANDAAPDADALRALHTCIKKVTEDVERVSMNTCVSHFMIATNELRRLNCTSRSVLSDMVCLLAPFGPHIAEELWQRLGHTTSVCDATWPTHNEEYLKTSSVTYPIQINGKLRGNIELATGISAAEAEQAALALPQIQKWMEGRPPKRVIFLPEKMINLVV